MKHVPTRRSSALRMARLAPYRQIVAGANAADHDVRTLQCNHKEHRQTSPPIPGTTLSSESPGYPECSRARHWVHYWLHS